jgi:hypothetical protein
MIHDTKFQCINETQINSVLVFFDKLVDHNVGNMATSCPIAHVETCGNF